MNTTRLGVALVLIVLSLTDVVWAYTTSETGSGAMVRWRVGQKLNLAGNPRGNHALSSSFIWDAVVGALTQWKWASKGEFDFDYWQGTDASVFKPGVSLNGLSSLSFASQSGVSIDSNVIGYTQLWFNSASGDLIETDVIFNDRNYQFTSNPSDTSSRSSGGMPRVYIPNVVTHELGHALGLSHSSSFNSSMLYVEYREQSHLGCDDIAGVKALYGSDPSSYGALQGQVLNPSGAPLVGGAVVAVSQATGFPLAEALTDQNGNYLFGSLPTGDYSLAVAPYQGASGSVPARFQARSSDRSFCGSSSFPLNVVGRDGVATRISVNSNQIQSAGTYRVNCSGVESASASIGSDHLGEGVYSDRASSGTMRTYTFQANGPFRVTGLGHLLLSPVSTSLSVVGPGGSAISVTKSAPVFSSNSGFEIVDGSLEGVAFGTVTLRVTAQAISMDDFPTPSVNPGSDSVYLLSIKTSGIGATPTTLNTQARCKPPETQLTYQSPAGGPVTLNASTETSRDLVGFCGSITSIKKDKNLPPPSAGTVLGWLAPFAMIGIHQILRRRRRQIYIN